MRIFVAFAVLALAACSTTAQLVERRYSPKRGGIVAFETEAMGLEARQHDAGEKMRQFCGGEATILSEADRFEPTGAIVDHGIVTNTGDDKRYVTFECK